MPGKHNELELPRGTVSSVITGQPTSPRTSFEYSIRTTTYIHGTVGDVGVSLVPYSLQIPWLMSSPKHAFSAAFNLRTSLVHGNKRSGSASFSIKMPFPPVLVASRGCNLISNQPRQVAPTR